MCNMASKIKNFRFPIHSSLTFPGTFKLKKLQYQKEGFDPEVIKEPLYFRSGDDFVPVTPELYTSICSGKVKL